MTQAIDGSKCSAPDPNPYAAPTAALVDDFRPDNAVYASRTLATRGQRLAALIIDLFFFIPVFVGVALIEVLMTGEESHDIFIGVVWSLTAIVALGLMGYNLKLLHSNQQTIGKYMMGIQIIRSDLRTPVTLGRIIGLRLILFIGFCLLPFVGGIIRLFGPLMIFRKSRQCFHDMIADTNVVICEPTAAESAQVLGEMGTSDSPLTSL